MSDSPDTNRKRSIINPLKILNQLREQRNLPKASPKSKVIRITNEMKIEVTRQEIERLFPEALTSQDYQFTDEQGKKLAKEVEIRIARIKSGKEALPEITVKVEKEAPAKTAVKKEVKAPTVKKENVGASGNPKLRKN